jgi:DNA repair exonuclease SbcCD ATPase subunit
MRLRSATLHNVGRFAHASIDLTTLSPEQRIINIDGDTGAGKSTLVEAMTGGALFRDFVTHGSLGSMCAASDSRLRTSIEHGGVTFDITHLVDGKKGESVLSSGVMAYNVDGKKTSFDSCVAKLFPDPELLYNSIWRKQTAEGFLQKNQAQRQDLILLATGATKWEGWAKKCRERAKDTNMRADTIRSNIAQVPPPNVQAWETVIITNTVDLENKAQALRLAESELAVAKESAGNSALAQAEYERSVKVRRE